MSELEKLARQILIRMDIASNGCHDSTGWFDAECNLSAPDGMSYDDWMEQAQEELISAIKSQASELAALKKANQHLEDVYDVAVKEVERLKSPWVDFYDNPPKFPVVIKSGAGIVKIAVNCQAKLSDDDDVWIDDEGTEWLVKYWSLYLPIPPINPNSTTGDDDA